ncbi:hypothetical protein ASD02_00665 [Ensifer sp. Root1252]|nr:hypothetical protein ASD02_00665 [Ensifer sp. Root1252]KRC83499.1 hypothetical protein ASE32_00660 [Ensifer sp. Root231]KRC86595.1 hypothetical protein ASE47_16990 [Ensifer sp. Root258]
MRDVSGLFRQLLRQMASHEANLSAQMVVVRTYILHSDGRLEPFSSMPLHHYGTCPNVGDTVCYSWFRERPTVFSVQRRYYIDNHDHRPGWAVVLREIEHSAQTDAVVKAWYDDDDWDDKCDAEDALEAQKERDRVHDRLMLLLGKPPEEFNLDHREETAIKKLSRRGVGVPLICRAIDDFGEGTRKRLHQRGFITVHSGSTGKFKDDEIALTTKGAKAWKDLKAYRKKVDAARNGAGGK